MHIDKNSFVKTSCFVCSIAEDCLTDLANLTVLRPSSKLYCNASPKSDMTKAIF